jgi:hypothetical protein
MKMVLPLLSGVLLGIALRPGPAQAAPIIEYRFDEIGATAVNTGTLGASGNGALNNILRSAENQPLGRGSSIDLNGSNSFVRVQNNFSYGNQVTVEAWIKPAQIDNQRIIWDDYGNPGVLLSLLNGAVHFNISTTSDPGPGMSLVTGAVFTNVWQHVAGVYDGQMLRVFINGRQADQTAATPGTIVEVASDPAIGADNGTTTALNFAGLMDDFRIHTQALSAEELGGGAFVRLYIATATNQAVLWWRTNDVAFRLESRTNLTAGSWQTTPETPSVVGSNLYVTNLLSATSKFYRLAFP